MSRADHVLTTIERLKADSATAAIVGSAVYGTELPASAANTNAPTAIVVKDAGGGGPFGYTQDVQAREDIVCYAATLQKARQLALTALFALNSVVRATGSDGSMVYSFSIDTMPTTLREPQTQWPVSMFVVSAHASLTAIS